MAADRRDGAAGLQRVQHGLALPMHAAMAQPARQLREMQVFEVPELGLSIWVENQPPWEAS